MPLSVPATITQVRTEHHTDRYKTDGLVVRRGLPVRLHTNAASLTISLVSAHPQNDIDLGYSFTLAPGRPRNDWILKQAEAGIVTLQIPVSAKVGLYVVDDGDESVPMVVLFNPFNEADDVYMPSEEDRNEYVLNDVGRIWAGSRESPSGVPWLFGQFRTVVLLVALSLLDSMPVLDRHDPIKVSRHLSAALNVQDDNGVLVGRWDGNYDDGTSPSAWTGSVEILMQYWTSYRPVSYGQCWVFSGLFTSVMRTLGLGSRCITNFLSAHDTTRPYNRAVDKYYDDDGKPVEDLSMDSIWNFHVWNEAFMKRPDLQALSAEHGLDYNGWQILDATPQEESSGLYQLGPAPLTAIKYGYTVPMDVDFVVGEVNADVVHYWKAEATGKYEVRKRYSEYVGQKISTKAVGMDERSDVTLDYKFSEGTPEERTALAGTRSRAIPRSLPQPVEEVAFEVESPPDVKVGEEIRFVVKGINKGQNPATMIFNCLYRATDYTGIPRARIGEKRSNVRVGPGLTGELVISLSAEEYERHLGRGVQTIQFNSSAKVAETGQAWSFESLVRLNAEEALHVRVPDRVPIGEPITATAVITNISHMPLTNVRLRAEGEGLTELTVIDLDTIEPGATVESGIMIEPSETGDRLLVTTLDTDEIKDVSRSAHIVVEDASGREYHGRSVWHGNQIQNIADLVQIQGRRALGSRKCCGLC